VCVYVNGLDALHADNAPLRGGSDTRSKRHLESIHKG
jgi:hypothetical protein